MARKHLIKSVVELPQAWKAELARLISGDKVSDEFIERLNRLLADTFHEKLDVEGKNGFRLVRSISQLHGKLSNFPQPTETNDIRIGLKLALGHKLLGPKAEIYQMAFYHAVDVLIRGRRIAATNDSAVPSAS